ncbi:MAG: tripartite tricarboxylate transporter substrate-binding protein [Pseudomonadota bacterium]|nr:tripartite tricarboxylate transporter substrate-binding protein [Pseudomonadota bacterium]
MHATGTPLAPCPPISRRRVLASGAAALAASAVSGAAWAQSDRTLRLVLPNAAGSGVDIIARAVQAALSRALGQTVVVDNQPGAGGVLGLQALSRAAPDGQTLSLVSNSVVTLPSVLKSMPFTMPDDFTPIAVVGRTPFVLVAHHKMGASNAQAFAAALKARPDHYTFGSGGTGSILHMAGEMYLDEANVTARHIPYKGVGQMVNDLVGGQLDFSVLGLASAMPHIRSGVLKAIGVASNARSPVAPDIPTFAEQGLPGYQIDGWFAVLGPKGLPPEQVKRAHDALVAAFSAPDAKEAMDKQGNIIDIGTPEAAQAFFTSEVARFAAVAKKAGVQPQ